MSRTVPTRPQADKPESDVPEKPSEPVEDNPPEEKPPKRRAAENDEPRWKKRLTTASLVLAVPIAVLAILGAVLDLPKKWTEFRREVVSKKAQKRQVLTGRLIDATTRLPLEGVQVQLPEQDQETVTNGMGVYRFELEVAETAQVRLTATLEGYVSIDRLFTVGPHQDDFSMRAIEP